VITNRATVRGGALAASLLVLAACGSDALPASNSPTAAARQSSCAAAPASSDNFAQTVSLTTTADGLRYGDITAGTGAMPQKGQKITVQYTGWLSTGCQFDTSRQAGRAAFSFVIGATPPNVIPGWEEGLLTMRVGGRRRLVIPPLLGYGATGQGQIPGGSTLVFDVELLSIG
jgi:peptidylprolyl isomerase